MNRPHIIIDGYNYILRQSHIDMSQEHALWDAREKLIHQMIGYLGQKRIRITIVFDGQDLKGISKIRRPAGISVRFSKAPQKADPLILNIIRKSRHPKNITLITSDVSLSRQAAAYGCLTQTSEAFAAKLTAPKKTMDYHGKYDVHMSPKEVQEWLKLFGEEDKD